MARASAPGLCRAKRHRFEPGSYPIIFTFYQYRLSCTVSARSLILAISSSHRSTNYGDGQCKKCLLPKKKVKINWFCRVNRKTPMFEVRKKRSFETKWRKCGDEMKCAKVRVCVRVWNNHHKDLPKCF